MEPKTIEEALAGEHAKEWKAAPDSEYESLMENETWELVELTGRQLDASGCSKSNTQVMAKLNASRGV